MENYLNNHKKNNLEILIYLLNKEGLTKLMKNINLEIILYKKF